MINNDQKSMVQKAAELAMLHKAKTNILPDILIASDPHQYIGEGPCSELELLNFQAIIMKVFMEAREQLQREI